MDIFLYDLLTGSEQQATCDPGADFMVDIDGDRIVWVRIRSSGQRDIFLGEINVFAAPTHSQIFWDEQMPPPAGTIYSANLDGSNPQNLFPLNDLGPVRGLAVDPINQKIYWSDSTNKRIRVANFDGCGAATVIGGLAATPGSLAMDPAAGKIYWASESPFIEILRANLDGTGMEVLVPSPGGGVRGLALDAANGKLYWGLFALGSGKIERANLDGTGREDVIPSGLAFVNSIGLDPAGNKMYWVDLGLAEIHRANLDGTSPELLVTAAALPHSMGLDVAAGKMYWSDLDDGNLYRADLNGANVEALTPAMPNRPEFIGLYISPNTPTGTNVDATPRDATTGSMPVTLTFDQVTGSGFTTLATSSSGPLPPDGFALGDPPVYYDLATSANFTGNIQICIDYSGTTFTDESAIQLRHFEGGAWVDVTTFRDPDNDIICGNVTSLSPFAILELAAIPVTVDIKPGSDPNSINPQSNELISVAILTTATFDATTVDPLSIKFGPNGAKEAHNKGHIKDADGDGDLDLLLHFKTPETGIQCGQTQASLTGQTLGGQAVTGTDDIQTVGCPAKSAAEEEAGIPDEYALEQNYPNPFNPETEIRFQLPEANHVVVKIFNTLGEEIRTLVDEERTAGYHLVRWDGKDKTGNPVASGVYLYQLRAGNPSTGSGQGFSQVRKMSLLR